MQGLREYTAQTGGKLPFSFDVNKVRTAYARVKAQTSLKKGNVSEKNIEYFLFSFKQLQMWPELIDACENFEKLTGGNSSAEIKQYYLTEALLSMPSSEHYYELVKQAVFNNEDAATPAYVCAVTKALLKDGAVDHAIKFFQQEILKLRDIQTKREDFLVTMFDSVYGDIQSQDAKISYQEYKDRYLD